LENYHKKSIKIIFYAFVSDGTPIQQFYRKKSIFMTGATGFLGKGELTAINIPSI